MSRKQHEHGTQSWFGERDEARVAGGAAPAGMAPEATAQDGGEREAVIPREPPGENVGNRGIGQYSGEGVPPRQKK